jgi:hypothetical protein
MEILSKITVNLPIVKIIIINLINIIKYTLLKYKIYIK